MNAPNDIDRKKPQRPPDGPSRPKQTSVPVDEEDIVHERPLQWKLVVRLLRFLKPYKLRMTLNVLLVAVGSAVMLLPVFTFGQIIAVLSLGPDHRQEFYLWVGVLAGSGFVSWLLEYYRAIELVKLGQEVLNDIRMAIFRHLQELSLGYYDRTKQGWIISRVTSDLGVLEEVLTWTIPQLAWVVCLVVGGMVVMWWLSHALCVVLLKTIPVLILVTFLFHGHIAEAWRNVRTQVSRICANLAENIAGVRVVQAFTRERWNLREFDRLNQQYYDARVGAAIVQSLYFPSIGLVVAVATAGILLTAGYEAGTAVDSKKIGDMVTAIVMLGVFFEPIRQLSMMYGNTLGAMASAERIFGLLDTVPAVRDRADARDLPPIRGRVRFEDVTFAYKPGQPVLMNIDVEAMPGETVALVGATGAGKSSIVNLLCRFYEQQEGRIVVDGCDLREVTARSLRSQMGIVNQDAFLFSGTVMDNIKFARPDASDEEAYAAARAIGAHEILAGLRDGYLTHVQERGEALSGGERQLVCFTRAMVADPRILVLDEATSSVDTTTELKIQEALERLVRKRTSFVVAHRLSTVRNAHQVLVVKDGRIIERGTHASLLAAGGEYARMYREFLREG
jgi:ABC-type multidrug transport system fused ATPase/permease subunit